MIQYQTRIILIAVVLAFLVPASCAADQMVFSVPLGTADTVARAVLPVPETTPVSAGATASEPATNYTKLEIQPTYMNFVVEPGETKEMTVTVRNRDTKNVQVRPTVRTQPYSGPFVAENSWTSVTPQSADIPAGESAKFTVRVSVPAGTLRGMYSSQLTFTDEAYPTPYPQPFPNYLHTLSLMINVASTPIIQISTPYISDQLEAGSEYSYSIDVKNKGTTPLALNAKVGEDGYPMYGPYGPQEPPLSAKSFAISAPATIPPGSNGTVTVRVNVPQNASGYYNGNIDLGIDDPSIRLEENRIQLNFLVWKQPEGGFAKKFTVTEAEPIAIELTSAMPMMSPMTGDGVSRNIPRREPSFDASLTGPDGKANLVLVEKVIKGSVNLGSDPYLGNGNQPAKYQESGSQYIFTYSAQGRPGQWTLAVMPRNTQSFEYRISLGGGEPAPATQLFTIPAMYAPNPSGK